MAGRKPLALGHVEPLSGSERAKARLKALLASLQGDLPVQEACRQLEIGESHFHQLRHAWLQGALDLLEPRPVGRPPRRGELETLQEENARLRHEADELRQQLLAVETRHEIERILAPAAAREKNAAAQHAPRRPPR